MNVLETEWWTVAVPPEWWAEADEDSILVGDRDDVGCIEISTLHKEGGDFHAEELRAIADAEAESELDWSDVRLGDFQGVTGAYMVEDAAIREWYVASGAMLLFITYRCDPDNRGMHDAPVDE